MSINNLKSKTTAVTEGRSGTRSRGRPPSISKQQVFDAALQLLQNKPQTQPTMANIAKALGVVPMTLYHHVSGIDEILDGVVATVFDELKVEISPNDSWQEQARTWMHSVREHLEQFPDVAPLLGSRTNITPSWLPQMALLGHIIEKAEFDDEHYALAVTMIILTATTFATAENAQPINLASNAIYQGLGSVGDQDREVLLRLARSVPQSQTVFDHAVAATLAEIEGFKH